MSIHFAHISDTHILSAADATLYEADPAARATKLVAAINRFPVPLDFVLHTGDIVDQPDDEAAYRRAADIFKELTVPVYYTTGNHDRSAQIRAHLHFGPRKAIDDERLDYLFEVKGEQFAVLDGRAPDLLDPQGLLNNAQYEWLQRLVAEAGPPLTICIHYAPLPINVPWIDDGMLLLGGSALHTLLKQARRPLRAVLHGHLHRPIQLLQDGVLYVCASSPFAGFTTYPSSEQMQIDPAVPLGFNFIQYLPQRTIVMQQQLGAAREQ